MPTDKPAHEDALLETTALFTEIRALLLAARANASRQVNTLLLHTNYEIGRKIVLYEQAGQTRAAYGRGILQGLSRQLTEAFGRGFSVDNLELMRKFYLTWPERLPKSENPSRISDPTRPFTLSWSHYVFLTGIQNTKERDFYEAEATHTGWKLEELRRQFDSSLYERLMLSRNREEARALPSQGQSIEKPRDLLKEPYVLEFLGLEERPSWSESDLENTIISKLEHFLLELGRGFLFAGRQQRFTFGEEHFFVDLVFYNRLLRCFVLIDLKIGKLTHQDLGQMQMYVNYYDRHAKTPEEGPTIGIILCKKKNDALVEITLPEGANIHAKEYTLVLPSKADLRQKLLEWTGED